MIWCLIWNTRRRLSQRNWRDKIECRWYGKVRCFSGVPNEKESSLTTCPTASGASRPADKHMVSLMTPEVLLSLLSGVRSLKYVCGRDNGCLSFVSLDFIDQRVSFFSDNDVRDVVSSWQSGVAASASVDILRQNHQGIRVLQFKYPALLTPLRAISHPRHGPKFASVSSLIVR